MNKEVQVLIQTDDHETQIAEIPLFVSPKDFSSDERWRDKVLETAAYILLGYVLGSNNDLCATVQRWGVKEVEFDEGFSSLSQGWEDLGYAELSVKQAKDTGIVAWDI